MGRCSRNSWVAPLPPKNESSPDAQGPAMATHTALVMVAAARCVRAARQVASPPVMGKARHTYQDESPKNEWTRVSGSTNIVAVTHPTSRPNPAARTTPTGTQPSTYRLSHLGFARIGCNRVSSASARR